MATTHTIGIVGGFGSFAGELQLDGTGSVDGEEKLAASTYTAVQWACIKNMMAELRRFDNLCGGLTSISVAAIP